MIFLKGTQGSDQAKWHDQEFLMAFMSLKGLHGNIFRPYTYPVIPRLKI